MSEKNYPDSPAWTKDLIIYEISTRVFTSPDGPGSGTLKSASEKIPYLQELGITCIWLTGHSLANPTHFYNIWTQYAVIEPNVIEPQIGTEQDLRDFVDTAHDHGIRVLLELVTHGVMKDSPLVERHPDWFNGESWGMADFDFDARNPEFDQWWVDVWTRYIVEFGFDGFRLDLGMRRPDLWQKIRENARGVGREIVVMNESEYKETVEWCQQSGMETIAPHEDYMQVIDFVQRDRYTLLNPHHKIEGEVNGDVGRAHNWDVPEWETWLENVIDQPQDVPRWAWSSGQLSCHDDGWEDFEGQNPYVANGSRFIFGYAILFSSLIPIFMSGEELDAVYQPLPRLSPRLFGGEDPGQGTWLYGGVVPWELLEVEKHQQMLTDVRQLIAIRKQEAKTLGAMSNAKSRNIQRVKYQCDVSCITPYIRWSDESMIVIAGNHYDNRAITLTLKLPQDKLNATDEFKITNLWSGDVSHNSMQELQNLVVSVPADKISGGGVSILKITSV